MFNRLNGSASPEFADREAEGMIARIRAAYRTVQQKQLSGDTSATARATQKADALLEAFRRRLLNTWGRRVERQIGFASEGEKEDAVAELQMRVLHAVADTKPSPSADHWERRFNQCVLRRAIDVCRPYRAAYGHDKEASAPGTDGVDAITFSASPQKIRPMFSELPTDERLPDVDAEKAIEAVLGKLLLHDWIAAVGEKDRHNLGLWWRQEGGETWESIGAYEGLLPDTVRKRVQATLKVLRRVAGAEPA